MPGDGTPGDGGARPEASVIVPCRGHADSLAPLLRDLAAQRTARTFDVIVVDAAADPRVLAAAEAAGARVVRATAPLLPGEARNLGASVSRAAALLFVDADCRVDETWLEAALAALRAPVRLVSGPVTDLRPRHPIARADNLLQFADLPRERPAGPMHMAPSCNLAVRAADFRNLGGFAHAGGLPTGEDVAFCERALARWPDAIVFAPNMAVRHAGRRTLAGLMRHHHAFGHSRGRLRLLLSERQARLGAMPVFAPALVLRRLLYVLERVRRWRPSALPVTLALLPLLALGAVTWTRGFRRGLSEAAGTGGAAVSVIREHDNEQDAR